MDNTAQRLSEHETAKDYELAYSAGTYRKRDLNLARGEGVYVFDDAGKRYIDCIGGIATASLGHAHPALVQAISEQAQTLMAAPELLCTPQRAAYQERLSGVLPEGFSRVFLCNSGAEALEAALKFTRLSTKRAGIVALKRGFHGKTMGALSATAEQKYREPFAPLLPQVFHVSSTNIEELEALFAEHGSEIGCFIFEAIQGEGGVRPLAAEFVERAVTVAREHGALVVADEVQCGVGRTGKMWGFEHCNVVPDIICMAKGIAGGVPMGAVGIGAAVAELPAQSHTSTFGGNPLACSAGLAVLETLERDALLENAARVGAEIRERLLAAEIPCVREIRGAGLMLGLELKVKAGPFIGQLQEKGLLCLLAGPRVVRLLPPLILSSEQAEEITEILIETLNG